MKRFHISKDNKYFVAQLTVLLALMSSLSPLATDTYVPAMPFMAKYFNVKINMVELTLTLYFLGIATGQLLGGPMSDSFGRKKVAIIGMSIFSMSSVSAMFVKNIEMLWVLRYVQASGIGCAGVVNMAVIRDWFEGKEVARLSSLMSMIMMAAPLVAPIIGTYLLVQFNWQAIFAFMFAFSLLVLVLFIIFMPESRDKQYLTKTISFKRVIQSYVTFFKSKKSLLLASSNSFAVAGMFTFLTGSSFLYIEYFKIDVEMFPLFFGSNITMFIVLILLNYRLVKTYEPELLLKIGLIVQFISGISLAIDTIIFTPNLIIVATSIMFYIASLGLVFSNVTAIIINNFPQISGSANAVIGVMRFTLSAIVGSIFALFHTEDLVPFGTILFLCTTIAFALYLFSKKTKF